MAENKFKKGDRVWVWSMQSFRGRGFLCGEPAFVRQDMFPNSNELVLCLVRKVDDIDVVDLAYSVYTHQVKKAKKKKWKIESNEFLQKVRKFTVKEDNPYHTIPEEWLKLKNS